MNLLDICHVFPPEHAPAGVNSRDLADDMSRGGHDVTVLNGWPHHPGGALYTGWEMRFRESKRKEGEFKVVRCGHWIRPRTGLVSRLRYYWTFAISTFVSGLLCRKPDIIYRESTPIFTPMTSLLLASLKRANFLYPIHDVHPKAALHAGLIRRNWTYKALRAVDTWVCTRSDLVLSLTDGMRRTLLARGLPSSKLAVARQWLDGSRITPWSRDNPWRQGQGIALDCFVVLYAGTIGHISNARVVIEAARLLRERSDILFLLVGDGPAKTECEALALGYSLDRVMFPPLQPAEVLADVQATCDVGLVTLLPASGDTSVPSKMHGYTAAGRPIIASVRGDSATAEAIRGGQCGLVIEPSDPQTLAGAIAALAANPVKAKKIARNARQFFCSNFARRTNTAHIETLLRIMLAGSQRCPGVPGKTAERTKTNHSKAA